MNLKILSPDQVEQFIDCGYTRVPEAFSPSAAQAACDFLWTKLQARGALRDDPSTWTQPMVHIQESYNDPVFEACLTPRLSDAVVDLVGPDRWNGYGDKSIPWGWWPVNFFRGAEEPWDVPANVWHWDGSTHKHIVDAPEQGLLLLCMFSETAPRSGATVVAEGSHQVVARYLNTLPEAMELGQAIRGAIASHPWLQDLTNNATGAKTPADIATLKDPVPARVARFMNKTTVDDHGTRLRVVEALAGPGDIYLCHPFLMHAPSPNHSRRPRFMCNRQTPLKERMNFNRPDANYSPLELSIRRALKM